MHPGLASPIIWKPSIPGPSSEVELIISIQKKICYFFTRNKYLTFWTKRTSSISLHHQRMGKLTDRSLLGSWPEPVSFGHHVMAFGNSVLYVWAVQKCKDIMKMYSNIKILKVYFSFIRNRRRTYIEIWTARKDTVHNYIVTEHSYAIPA